MDVPLIGFLMNGLLNQFQPQAMQVYARKMGYSPGYVQLTAKAEDKPGGIAAWPFWARFALNQVVLAVVSLAIAVVAITPRKPWQAWRFKRREQLQNR